jgi:hypothetical protein
MALSVGRNNPCPCGSGRKFKRCCLDREREAATAAARAYQADIVRSQEPSAPDPWNRGRGSRDLTRVIETPAGVMVRSIPNASPLRLDLTQGEAAEEATHDAAALWGLPDFVYRAETRKVGSGSRELGDGILLVGELGIVVQVKCREAPTADEEKERRWVEKQMAKALAQANGTIRLLKQAPSRMTNARGRSLEIDGSKLRWIAAIVIDHPHAPSGITAESLDERNPAVVMLRRDWEFLFNQLKSAHAVGGYLERVSGEVVELGEEPVRYFQLAAADQQAQPEPVDPALLGATGRQISSPLLPLQPVATDDEVAHLVVRLIFEDIAVSGLPQTSEPDRLLVLAELDRLPVSDRGMIGRFLIEGLSEIVKTPAGTTEWRQRRVVGRLGGRQIGHLAFGVCSQFSQMHSDLFLGWVRLRHHDLQQVTGEVDHLTTIGVLLTPRNDGLRPWDTTMFAVAGDLGLTAEELSASRELWRIED